MLTVREVIESKIKAMTSALASGEAWLETEFHLAEQHVHDFFKPPSEALILPVGNLVPISGAGSAGSVALPVEAAVSAPVAPLPVPFDLSKPAPTPPPADEHDYSNYEY